MIKEKFLLLGISSFAGASMADYLIKQKKNVFGTYRNTKIKPYLPFKYNENKENKVKLIKVDLLKDSKKILRIVKKIKPDYIIDFASICMVGESWVNPKKYYDTNLIAKIELIKNLHKLKKLKKYIYISTPEVFGSSEKYIKGDSKFFFPNTPYAASKLSCELLLNSYVKNFNSPIIIARFSNFYGPGQPLYRLIPKIIMHIDKKIKFPLEGKGGSKRNFIYTDDFCNAIMKVCNKAKLGSIYHFSGKNFYTVLEIIKTVCRLKKYNYKKLIEFKKDRIGKDQSYKLDATEAKKKLSWKPNVSINEGINMIIKYQKKYYNEMKNAKTFYDIK
jgi:dTDP-glucose 4,6-dehydratase